MSDRELLELAAKAVGITLDFSVRGDCPPYYINERGGHSSWSPLADDGDALRLAVKLGLRVDTPKYMGFGSSCGNVTVFQEGCPHAQTRRAIVRAAAELGKHKP